MIAKHNFYFDRKTFHLTKQNFIIATKLFLLNKTADKKLFRNYENLLRTFNATLPD